MERPKTAVPAYRIGDVVWCKWSTMWWPAMITYDPHLPVYFKTLGKSVTSYHVQYFGILAQRGWVKASAISILNSIGEKRVRSVRRSLQRDYEVAMKEASQAVKLSLKHRKLRFIFSYSQQKQPVTKAPKVVKTPGAAKAPVAAKASAAPKAPVAPKAAIIPKPKPRAPPTNQDTAPPMNQDAAPPTNQDAPPPTNQVVAPPSKQVVAPPTYQVVAPPTKQVVAPPTKQVVAPPTKQVAPPIHTLRSAIKPPVAVLETNSSQLASTTLPKLLTFHVAIPQKSITLSAAMQKQVNAKLINGLETGSSQELQMLEKAPSNHPFDSGGFLHDHGSELPSSSFLYMTPPNSGSDAESLEPDHKMKKSWKDEEKPESKTTTIQKSSRTSTARQRPAARLQRGVCCICDQSDGGLVGCTGHCFRLFHHDCLGLLFPPVSAFTCDECILAPAVCFACKGASRGDLVHCSHLHCDKSYHRECIAGLTSFKLDSKADRLTCALHCCAKCSHSDRLHGALPVSSQLVQCIHCPLALHRSTCLIAGCEMLTNRHMVCYRHLKVHYSQPQSLRHINVNACLECGEGGTLVCCEFCPAGYHLECLPEEKRQACSSDEWLCPTCSEHDLPTYGSIVFSKCGHYRWWPAEIIPEKNVPTQFLSSKPTSCVFLVRFYGTGQYSWTHHGRCIIFTECEWMGEGKNSRASISKTTQDFRKACQEALLVYQDRHSNNPMPRNDSKVFISIKRNKYLVPRPVLKQEIEPCRCTPDTGCAESSNCINRALLIECDPKTCPTGDRCQNQRIGKQQSADTVPLYTGGRGWGLKATHDIKQGDFVVEYIGEVLDMPMCLERLRQSQESNVSNFYFLTLQGNLVIDASRKSNHARFINHSCCPNCETQKWTVNGETRIGIFSIKDIPADTELTFDYQLDSLGHEKKKCLCGSANCSGYLGVRPKQGPSGAAVDKLKRKRTPSSKKARKPKLRKLDHHEDDCFVCKNGGRLVMCDHPGCPKVYHLACIGLNAIPKADFVCPWHCCAECGEESVASCSSCPTAYCTLHVADNFQTVCKLCIDRSIPSVPSPKSKSASPSP